MQGVRKTICPKCQGPRVKRKQKRGDKVYDFYVCLPCKAERAKEYRAADPEGYKAAGERYRNKNKDKIKKKYKYPYVSGNYNKYQKPLNDASQKYALNAWQRWTPEEDEILIDPSFSKDEKVKILRRSLIACAKRLDKLKMWERHGIELPLKSTTTSKKRRKTVAKKQKARFLPMKKKLVFDVETWLNTPSEFD